MSEQTPHINILLVEDREDDALVLILNLENAGYDVTWKRVETRETLQQALNPDIDIVLSDHSLPNFTSEEALMVVKQSAFTIPFIVVSGHIPDEVAIQLMKQGAADFLLKDRLSRLGDAVRLALQQRDLLQKQQEAERDNKILGHAVQSAKSAIVIANAEGIITYANDAFADMLQVDLDSRLSLDVIWSNSSDLRSILESLLYGETLQGELSYHHADSDHVTFAQYTASQIMDSKGQIECLMVTLLDVTEQRRAFQAQAELEKQQALNRMKERFTSMLIHDFRNPLTSIQISAANVLKYEEKFEREQLLVKFSRIFEQATQLEELIDDVLPIYELQNPDTKIVLEPINAIDVCKSTFDEICTSRPEVTPRLQFVTNTADQIVNMNERLFRRALLNLLSNAIKYSDKSTPITLRLSNDATHFVVEVIDQGIGIPPAEVDHIFDDFFRASNTMDIRGTGLGLSIIRLIIELHNGEIAFYSVLDEGTRFVIKLPLN